MKKAHKIRNSKVKYMGCIICELYHGIEDTPSDLHHMTEGGQRLGDEYTLPICPEHHRHGSVHIGICSGKKAFNAEYMTERELLAIVNERIGYVSNEVLGINQ